MITFRLADGLRNRPRTEITEARQVALLTSGAATVRHHVE